MLARRPRTAAEIAAALGRRGLDEAVVEGVVEELRASRLVDDAAVADAVVREAERRRRGTRRVAHELQRRGVSSELREAAVAASAAGEAEAARRVVGLRFPGGVPRDRRGIGRALRMLVARGFSADAARRALGIDVDVEEE
jgi:SOS response regulatory protein OraA/RecX